MITRIAISRFKSHCLQIMEELQTKHQSIIITKRDKPIAQITPFDTKKKSLFGMLKEKGEIKGDIINHIEVQWDAEYE